MKIKEKFAVRWEKKLTLKIEKKYLWHLHVKYIKGGWIIFLLKLNLGHKIWNRCSLQRGPIRQSVISSYRQKSTSFGSLRGDQQAVLTVA